jgi:hypothetical protein
MPSLRELGLDQNPSKHPLSYPGQCVRGSCLLVGDWLYPLLNTRGNEVAEWSIEAGNGPLSVERCTVDMALQAVNAASMAERRPVLAVGSNASPGQLAHKYASWPTAHVIPITCVNVTGIAVAHSAHASMPGYVPYAPVRSLLDCEIELHALWLDAAQTRHMDETEPNYRRLTLHAGNVTAWLESGHRLYAVTLYAGRWGILRLTSDGARVPATTQFQIFTLLGSQEWFRNIVPESLEGPEAAVSALGRDAGRRGRVRQEMAERHLSVSDGMSMPVKDSKPTEPVSSATPSSTTPVTASPTRHRGAGHL